MNLAVVLADHVHRVRINNRHIRDRMNPFDIPQER